MNATAPWPPGPPATTTAIPLSKRLRAPRRHGEAVVEPSFDQATALAESNQPLLREEYDFQGKCRCELTPQAQRELVELGRRYTLQYRDFRPKPALGCTEMGSANEPACGEMGCSNEFGPLLVSGHQPTLFHPGVWFKNFALDALASQVRGLGINIIIDNDAAPPPSIRVPVGGSNPARVESIVYDKAFPPAPIEERPIQDFALFESFAGRVVDTMAPLIPDPLATRFWPTAIEAAKRTHQMGAALQQARHIWEGRWDLQTLEAPLGAICSQEPFLWFTVHLLANLRRFGEVYNASLHAYRRHYRIRSRSHPAPDLIELPPDGGVVWREAPYWVWSVQQPRRRKLYVRQTARCLELSDRRQWRAELPLWEYAGGQNAVQRLVELAGAGVKLRPRALITTMYARLFLGDLFLHGIGGAKYDEVTDVMIQRFFGLTPPGYVTLSATVCLPIELPTATSEQLRENVETLRRMHYHPERYLPPDVSQREDVQRLTARKRHWIFHVAAGGPPGRLRDSARQRHRQIEETNQALRSILASQREQQAAILSQLRQEVHRSRLWGSREFAFPLFPESFLRPLLLKLAQTRP